MNENREQQMMADADKYADEVCDESCTGAQVAETINDFCAGWRAADSHPQWIPVEKTNQLPPKIEGEEITEYYWVAGLYGRWYDVLRYDYRDGRWSDHYGNYHACVTHWMPIVPPQGKEE